jgi:hypothetical protein
MVSAKCGPPQQKASILRTANHTSSDWPDPWVISKAAATISTMQPAQQRPPERDLVTQDELTREKFGMLNKVNANICVT